MAGCSSLEERQPSQSHQLNQIEMIRVQKDAEAMQKAAEANAKAKLYEALAAVAVARSDKDQS